MAFRFKAYIEGEFRRRKVEPGKDGKTYRSFTVENTEGYVTEISVRNEELWTEDVERCQKGAYYRFPIIAVATEKYSYVQLADSPVEIADENGEVL